MKVITQIKKKEVTKQFEQRHGKMFWKYINLHTSYGNYMQAIQQDIEDMAYYRNENDESVSKSEMSWTEEDNSMLIDLEDPQAVF